MRYLSTRIANAIAHIHAKGFAHLDICSSNVLLTAAGVPQVADFSDALPWTQGDLPLVGYSIGTLGFRAPEIIACLPYTTDADWFSYGVVVYHMLHGRCVVTARRTCVCCVFRVCCVFVLCLCVCVVCVVSVCLCCVCVCLCMCVVCLCRVCVLCMDMFVLCMCVVYVCRPPTCVVCVVFVLCICVLCMCVVYGFVVYVCVCIVSVCCTCVLCVLCLCIVSVCCVWVLYLWGVSMCYV